MGFSIRVDVQAPNLIAVRAFFAINIPHGRIAADRRQAARQKPRLF
jgi:hypothetical protein